LTNKTSHPSSRTSPRSKYRPKVHPAFWYQNGKEMKTYHPQVSSLPVKAASHYAEEIDAGHHHRGTE
jgi:hypothetical protein